MKQRITISLDEDQAAKFDQLIAERGYENRSEAFRDLIRAAEASQTLSDP
ncbi:ribbon-helix-helix protein, CopG family, partial [Sutterella wadsworthensis]